MVFNIGDFFEVKTLPEFSYSGTYQLIDDGKSGGKQNWRIKFLTSGVLRFTKVYGNIDVFLVGGGAGGHTSFYDGAMYVSCGASGGGYTVTQRGVSVQTGVDYQIVIGDGGAVSSDYTAYDGGTTTGFGYQALGGKTGGFTGSFATGDFNPKGGDGGSGGADYGGYAGGYDGGNGGGENGGIGQGTTTAEFGEAGQTIYATGGSTSAEGYGTTSAAPNGAANTGNGGTSEGGPSVGGSGILVIRNAR